MSIQRSTVWSTNSRWKYIRLNQESPKSPDITPLLLIMPNCSNNQIEMVCIKAICSITENATSSTMAAPLKSNYQKELEQDMVALYGDAAKKLISCWQRVCTPPLLIPFTACMLFHCLTKQTGGGRGGTRGDTAGNSHFPPLAPSSCSLSCYSFHALYPPPLYLYFF